MMCFSGVAGNSLYHICALFISQGYMYLTCVRYKIKYYPIEIDCEIDNGKLVRQESFHNYISPRDNKSYKNALNGYKLRIGVRIRN